MSFLIRNWGVRVPRVSGMVRLSHGIQSVNVASIGKSLSSVRRSFSMRVFWESVEGAAAGGRTSMGTLEEGGRSCVDTTDAILP